MSFADGLNTAYDLIALAIEEMHTNLGKRSFYALKSIWFLSNFISKVLLK
jgi:hypothetical protein